MNGSIVGIAIFFRGSDEHQKPDDGSSQGLMKNLIVAQAAVGNYASTRDIKDGSWYIKVRLF